MSLDLGHAVCPPRGTRLLLAHCAILDRLTDGTEHPADERLDRTLGSELARQLVRVLARGQAVGPCSLRGR
ncbi:MAG: hypothetical protein U0R69_07190 [Gaiellales bacterium]